MTLLLGSVGWGLLTLSAITHVWHHVRLRQLLALHLDHERVPALALTAVEALLAIAIPACLFAGSDLVVFIALAALILGLGFAVWIARLLVNGSTLPCACSFSEMPTTIWSLARACCVMLVGFFALAPDEGNPQLAATLIVGLALSASIFVLPEALSWPDASRALLARVDAYDAGADTVADAGGTT